MSEPRILYPGTFDPITNGHVDLITRAARLFNEVIVAISANPQKRPTFDLSKRLEMAQAATAHIEGVSVVSFDSLLTEFAEHQQCKVVLRGLRALTDFEYELQLANMNRRLKEDFETLFLTPGEEFAYVSSSLVREIASYGGDVSRFVPAAVAQVLGSQN